MTAQHDFDAQRRVLGLAVAGCGGLAAAGLAWPLLATLGPSRQTLRAGAPTELRYADLPPGQRLTLLWRGQPIWLLHRTPAMLQSLQRVEPALADPNSLREALPTPAWARNRWRSRLPELLVLRGVCTHLGCIPRLAEAAAAGLPADWPGGFVCPCHGSRFDWAGRVFRDMPAPDNLFVPPYSLLGGGRLLLGDEGG